MRKTKTKTKTNSIMSREELFEFGAELLGQHYKKEAKTDCQRMEEALGRELTAFFDSQSQK